jgi:hypothetical protein
VPNLPVPARLEALARVKEERGLVKQAKALRRRAMEIRNEDAARRYIALGRMQDVRRLTEDALEAGGEIADCLAAQAWRRPFFARELEEIASTGARGLKAELRFYIEECH